MAPVILASDPDVPNSSDYLGKWQSMTIRPNRLAAVQEIAHGIISNKSRYQSVERISGVPWYVTGVLNKRESDEDFDTYLGNGQSIHRKTTIVPAGRGPFSTWEAGALDALAYDGLDKIRNWPIDRIAYECERFNGFGYRIYHPSVPSPYLWSFSNHYVAGKYVGDGNWSARAIDQQCGVMPMLRVMADMDSTIKFGETAVVEVAQPLLDRVIRGMEAKGYRIDKEPGHVNIAYAEGHDRDGKRNNDRAGYWNDVRMIWTYKDGKPALGGQWTATTRPGPYYTENPINSKGAANIMPGQYAAWKVGLHRGQYEALVQRGTLRIARDKNQDYDRAGDVIEIGDYEGINQHHGSDAPEVGPHSAGCLVARMVDGHEDFMSQVKQDPRFVADNDFMFTSTILAQDEIPE